MKEWTSGDLKEFLAGKKTGLAYFFTPLCGTCMVASRMLDVLHAMLPDVEIGKVDLNYAPDMAESFEILSVPCLFLIKEGQIIESIYAFQSVPYLLDKVHILF